MAEEYKHDFIDDYPYLVYCDDGKAVYTNESDVPYIPDGGGGAQIGDPVKIILVGSDAKSGDYIYGGFQYIETVYLGDKEVVTAGNGNYLSLIEVASGIKVESYTSIAIGEDDDAIVYLVTSKLDEEESEVIDTITPLETDVHTYIDNGHKYFTLTIPEIQQGAYLGIYWQEG